MLRLVGMVVASDVVPLALTPAQRSERARIAALTRWSRTADRTAATAAARAGRRAAFERQVDPDGALDPAVRAQLADAAEAAHLARMRYVASRARAARKR